jgi:uncharacterized membrane protein YidH (DUF202 family)
VVSDALPGWSGHDPGVIGSLANERTGLAWQRTALSWVASGATVARYFASGGLLQARTSIGWSMVAIGAFVGIQGLRHYHRHDNDLRSGVPTRMPVRTIRVVWLATTVMIFSIAAIETAAL